MQEKRRAAQRAARAKTDASKHSTAKSTEDEHDVVPWLMQLGYRADEARRAAECCGSAASATLEERVKLALAYFRPRTLHRSRAVGLNS